MEETNKLIFKFVFKRIFYYQSNYKDIIIKNVKLIKEEILTTNSCTPLEYIVYYDCFGIYCNNETIINLFERALIRKLPDNILIYPHYIVHPVNLEDIRKFQVHTDLPLGQCIFQAIKVIKETIEKFTLQNIFLCFNGGKDCVVLLYLLQTVIEELEIKTPLKIVYFQSDDQFPEEEDYVQTTIKRSKLDLLVIKGEIKSGLHDFLKENPQYCASVIGTRQSDTGSKTLQFFQKTDPGWPLLIRVQPLLYWNYENVWSFLRQFTIPYCCLYDKGYTSLGNMSKSHPNPNLKYIDEVTGEVKYWPAFLLQNSDSERDSRL